MSWWASLEATFTMEPGYVAKPKPKPDPFNWMPKGSEYEGPGTNTNDYQRMALERPCSFRLYENPETDMIRGDARLRDFQDEDNAGEVLAWVMRAVRYGDVLEAEIEVHFDEGVFYRWHYSQATGLKRVRGVLDQ